MQNTETLMRIFSQQFSHLNITPEERQQRLQVAYDAWIPLLHQLPTCEVHSVVQQTDDQDAWLMSRTHGIGGSDIAAIMGESTWKSAYDIWMSKTGQLVSDSAPQSEAARWGNVLEDSVAYEWARRNNRKIIKMPITLRSIEHPYMLANIDGFVLLDDGVTIEAVLEIKTTSQLNKNAWADEKTPFYYVCQATWYTMITGLPKFYIVCLIGGQYLVDRCLPSIPDLCERERAAAETFWNVNVKQLISPAMQAADLERLKAVEMEVRGEKQETDTQEALAEEAIVDDTEEADRLVNTYRALGDKEAALKKIRSEVLAQILERMCNKRVLCTATTVVKKSITQRKSCDFDLLLEKYPQAYEEVVKQTTSSRITIT